MTTAKRNLKDQVLALRQEGKTLQQIKHKLGCSLSTVAYHIYGKTKMSTRKRTYARRKLVGRFENKTQNSVIYAKYYQFFRIGKWRKFLQQPTFTFKELLQSLPNNPTCYLTGEPLDYSDPKSYSFDHKVPSSRGGENSIANLGLCSAKANRAKSDMTEPEFVDFCKQVLTHHGYIVQRSKLVPPEGLQPSTSGMLFKDSRCSGELSYRGISAARLAPGRFGDAPVKTCAVHPPSGHTGQNERARSGLTGQ